MSDAKGLNIVDERRAETPRSDVPGGLVGRTWQFYSYHKLLQPSGGGFLGSGQPVISPFFVIFLLVLSLTLLTSCGVFVIYIFFFSKIVFFKCWPLRLRGGGQDR